MTQLLTAQPGAISEHLKVLSIIHRQGLIYHVVTNGSDQGPGSLRSALACVNAGDTIRIQLSAIDSIKL